MRGKAINLGAIDGHVVDAREEFAREYVPPAIRANADYGDGYPLFTSLGRPLIAKLAVEYARTHRLRHDRPRLHRQGQRPGAHRGDDRHAGARAQGDRAGALVADGPRRGDRLRAQARHPGQGRRRERAVLDRRQPLGPLRRRASGSRTSRTRPTTTSSSSSPGPSWRPTSRRPWRSSSSEGVPVALDGERLGLVELHRARRRARHAARRRDPRPHRGPDRRPEGARHLRGARPPRCCSRPTASSSGWSGTIHQNQFKPELDHQWAYLVYAGLWWEPLREDIEAYIEHVNRRVTGKIGLKLYKGIARASSRARAQRGLRRPARHVRRVRRPVLPARLAGVHRDLVAAVPDGHGAPEGRLRPCSTSSSAC